MMTIWQRRLRNWIHGSVFAGAGLGLCAAGCGKTPAPDNAKVDTISNAVQPGDPAKNPAEDPTIAAVNYNQSFDEAANTEMLDGHEIPPDITLGGKKTGLLREAIEESWPKIRLADSAGKPIPYALRIETSEGPIEIQLRPEIAPNHVRNIIALTKAGYYDGLLFERNIHQRAELEGQKSQLDILIAGCPKGTGDDGFGHVGYFMRAEFQPELKHREGTVGFWHEEDPDSAGCRFYITLGPAPILDGKFTVIGNVSQGLDIVRKIAAQPVRSADASPENELPVTPTVIQKATISPDALEKTVPIVHNDKQ